MPLVADYYRPDSLDEALLLLAKPNRRALAGGTVVVPEARQVTDQGVGLVDLQALGLESVTTDGNRLRLGAMSRLGELLSHDGVPTLLRQLCRRELPSALRNQATIGGTIALGDADSVLVAGLLVYGAIVHLHGDGHQSLDALLAQGVGQRLVTAVTVETDGVGVIAATGRTPADVPIVAAVAVRNGERLTLALTGVAAVPLIVDAADPTAGLNPPADFRGSADYRLHLAATLSQRAIEEVTS